MSNTCQNCQHWFRESERDWPNPDRPLNVGQCGNQCEIGYWDTADEADKKIEAGKLGCSNLYTHEDFGCNLFLKRFLSQ